MPVIRGGAQYPYRLGDTMHPFGGYTSSQQRQYLSAWDRAEAETRRANELAAAEEAERQAGASLHRDIGMPTARRREYPHG
jgi:hypothetical protein